MDGGGIFKEFVEAVVKEGFDPNVGLFQATTDNRLYPNPHAQVGPGQGMPVLVCSTVPTHRLGSMPTSCLLPCAAGGGQRAAADRVPGQSAGQGDV